MGAGPAGAGKGAAPGEDRSHSRAWRQDRHKQQVSPGKVFCEGPLCQLWIRFHPLAHSWQLAWEWLSVLCPCPFLPGPERRHRWWQARWRGSEPGGQLAGAGLSDVTQAELQLSGCPGRGLVPGQAPRGGGVRARGKGLYLEGQGQLLLIPGGRGRCASLEGREEGRGRLGSSRPGGRVHLSLCLEGGPLGAWEAERGLGLHGELRQVLVGHQGERWGQGSFQKDSGELRAAGRGLGPPPHPSAPRSRLGGCHLEGGEGKGQPKAMYASMYASPMDTDRRAGRGATWGKGLGWCFQSEGFGK